MVTFSIVSHNQSHLIGPLLKDFASLPFKNFVVIITINIPEDESPYYGHPISMVIIRNVKPKGFGENHNSAFTHSKTDWFIVVNPDIRIKSLDITALLIPFEMDNVAAVAPIVLSIEGAIEDNARRFPSLYRLVKRVFSRNRSLDYVYKVNPFLVDWVAGMFVVFRAKAFGQINGFDSSRFYMYLEDADICYRLNKAGWRVMLNPQVNVIHIAQRESHRKLRYMAWHLVSAFRYLTGF